MSRCFGANVTEYAGLSVAGVVEILRPSGRGAWDAFGR
jgi:hypothetical protein